MRLRILILMVCCLVLPAQDAPGVQVSLGFRNGAVVVEAPPGAHLKRAFMEVKLQDGTPGRLVVGPLPPANGQDELGDEIWRGAVAIPVKGQGLSGKVGLLVTYQPCTEGAGGVCYAPRESLLRVDARDLAGTSAPAKGLFWAFLGVFAAGIAASLTPCVYPMIPIVLVIVGAKNQPRARARGFLLSLALVLGMAVTYTALGVLAAASGQAFGAQVQRPVFLIPVSLLFVAFALSLFGIFEIRLPAALQARFQASGRRGGVLGAFLMGLVLGPLSAPCVGPVIGTVLLAIASEGRILLGALQLFTFALGMGVLFMAVGAFSAALPRSGEWLGGVKRIMGMVALGFAVWNVRTLVPGWLYQALWTAVLLAGAGVLGAFRPSRGVASSLGRGLGLMMLVLGLLLGVKSFESGTKSSLLPGSGHGREAEARRSPWMEQDYEGALAKARAGGKLLVVDVYADWCAACKELDEKTWPDPDVSAWLARNAVAVRIDTHKVRRDLAASMQIRGYPTVLVISAEGEVLRRREGFQEPLQMLQFLLGT